MLKHYVQQLLPPTILHPGRHPRGPPQRLVALRGNQVTDVMFATEDGQRFREFGRLPSARGGHCLVVLNETSLFVAGGEDSLGRALRDAWIFSKTRAWARLPDIPAALGLKDFSCGKTLGPETNNIEVVIAGGSAPRNVYIFDAVSMTWRFGRK